MKVDRDEIDKLLTEWEGLGLHERGRSTSVTLEALTASDDWAGPPNLTEADYVLLRILRLLQGV